MSSFKRRAPASTTRCPPGCIPSPSNSSLPLLSTGIPSLNDVLGGGLALGSNLSILAPDEHSAWSKLLERYFIAQGLASGHDVIVLGGEGEELELRDLVKGCMWVDESIMTAQTEEPDSDAEGLEADDGNRTRIAWRYAKMKKFQTSVQGEMGAGTNFSHALNLTTTLPTSIISNAESSNQLNYLTISHSSSSSSSSFVPLARLLETLQQILMERKVMYREESEKEPVRAVRVLVHDLGSLAWGENLGAEHILRFNHSLRSIIRDSLSSSLTTYPPSLSTSPPIASARKGKGKVGDKDKFAWLKSLGWGSDACIELQGFGSDPSLSVSFPHSHGILHIHSLPSPSTLLPPSYRHSTLLGLQNGAGQNNLSFRLKRKRFVVETLHLGVEGGVGERRTEPGPGKGNKAFHVHEDDGKGHVHDHQHEREGVEVPSSKEGRAKVKVGFEETMDSRDDGGNLTLQQEQEAAGQEDDGHRKKVTRKKVGWATVQHDKPELYDF